jgi:hypothetical protein
MKITSRYFWITGLAMAIIFTSPSFAGNEQQRNSSASKKLKISAIKDLHAIYGIAAARGPLTKTNVEKAFNVPLSSNCGNFIQDGKRIDWCNYEKKFDRNSPVNILSYNSTGSQLEKGGKISWAINNTEMCIDRNDIHLIFPGIPKRPKTLPIRDYPPGGERMNIIDYEIEIPKNSGGEASLLISELDGCTTRVILVLSN